MELDVIAGFEGARDRLLTDPRAGGLALRIVRIEEEDVERYLPVNAHRLDLGDDALLRPLQHPTSIGLPRQSGAAAKAGYILKR